jgi:septal ring factor EnvC (AmiA/AmiB activator)
VKTTLFLCSLFLLSASAAGAQQTDLEKSRQRLDAIRQEREALQRQQSRLQSQVSDVGAKLRNIEAQRDATNRVVNTIELQVSALATQLDQSTSELTVTEDSLVYRKAVLQRRLADIYIRGPLHTFQVLLEAESFADLLTRYKYLYLTSRQDRLLVNSVAMLADNVKRKRDVLLGVRTELDQKKEEHEAEMRNYDKLTEDQQAQLSQLQHSSQVTKQRLTAVDRDEASVTSLVASLQKSERLAAASRAARPETANLPPVGSLSTSDIGKLDWPVEGDIVIRFGPDTLPAAAGGGVIRWTGIGIKAPVGTPIKAVAAGRVVRVERLSTYGLGVVVQHGNGYYSLYWQLQNASVKEGDQIARGAVVGTVGGQNSAQGPHLYFEIRGENQIALDPIAWLKSRR